MEHQGLTMIKGGTDMYLASHLEHESSIRWSSFLVACYNVVVKATRLESART